jgi:hypothetical protein
MSSFSQPLELVALSLRQHPPDDRLEGRPDLARLILDELPGVDDLEVVHGCSRAVFSLRLFIPETNCEKVARR